MVKFRLQIWILLIVSNEAWKTLETIAKQRSRRVMEDDQSSQAIPHSKPWSAVLLTEHEQHAQPAPCGAFLINRPPYQHDNIEQGSSDLLITAAHCLMQYLAMSTLRREASDLAKIIESLMVQHRKPK
uniref:Uncharacterized protein n=1 Tax=Romanomermis culicivorax TaxID=13658 RepID=A0A915IGS7_ROMCU